MMSLFGKNQPEMDKEAVSTWKVYRDINAAIAQEAAKPNPDMRRIRTMINNRKELEKKLQL